MPKNAVSGLEITRLTISWSKQADLALRSYLGAQGMKKGDISKFIEEAVRWRIFYQTVRGAREAFADIPPHKLQKMIDQAVDEVRTKRGEEKEWASLLASERQGLAKRRVKPRAVNKAIREVRYGR